MFRLILLFAIGGLAPFIAAKELSPPVPLLAGNFRSTTESFDPRWQTLRTSGAFYDSLRGDGDGTGQLQLRFAALPKTLELYVAGFPLETGESIELRSADGARVLKLALRANPSRRWCFYRWQLPSWWHGRDAVLVANDGSRDNWLGIGVPTSVKPALLADAAGLLRGCGVILLTVLPFFTVLAWLAHRDGSDPAMDVTLALVASGLYALMVFFAFFFSRVIGFACLAIGGLATIWVAIYLWRKQAIGRGHFMWPVTTVAFAVAMLATTFLYGGIESPEGIPATRHDRDLPPDNQIPGIFADMIYRHAPLRPFLSDWLTSDRPPLQSGYMLISQPLLSEPVDRLAAAITSQLALYAGLWVLLHALGVSRRTALLCLIACASSGFFLLNTIYTWPKLLPAGFLLAATGLLFRIDQEQRHAFGREIVALGACAALAMLSHGGSFFGLAGLAVVHALRGGWRDLGLAAGGGAVALLLFSPWLAYQHWADPPGDRLIKYHLASRQDIDPRGALPVIAEAYRNSTATQIFENKWSNFRVLVGDFPRLWPNLRETAHELVDGRWTAAYWRFAHTIRGGAFFHLIQSLGFLALGLSGFLFRSGDYAIERRAAWYCLSVMAAGIAIWCGLMFGPEGTVIHQGSYLTGALLHIAAVLGLVVSGRRRLLQSVFLLHFALAFGIWILSPEWESGRELLRPTWSYFWGLTLVTCVGVVAWLSSHLAIGSDLSPSIHSGVPKKSPAARRAAAITR